MKKSYEHTKIEKKWQDVWAKDGANVADENSAKPKEYVLDMFPYPSGAGLHVGHVEGYTATDIYSRFKRMNGANVLHPMGWDAFGLPAENYAIKTKVHPDITTNQSIDNFRKQIKSLGLSYDWTREIGTHTPEYYKWTQWFFLLLYKNGLAYRSKGKVNWCSKDQTVLANEQVVDGKCERCGTVVEQKDLEQWYFKITKYADDLIAGLDTVDWPHSTKAAQKNWIGRSEGAEITFTVENTDTSVLVYTTRPDTVYGATYLVLAPEHALVATLGAKVTNSEVVQAYIANTKKKTDLDRQEQIKDKTGVELAGVKAKNPATGASIPIYIADYVLPQYGTGAIMAVPAHDQRDYEFAQKFELPIVTVIEPVYTQSTEPGKVVEGQPFDHRDAIIAIVKHWSEDKYMALKWKKVAWGTFITGGIEKGQTAEEAAKMEIREETGYLNAKLIADYGVIHGKFYHVPKKVNRFAHSRTLVFQLENDVQDPVSLEEQENHEVLWKTKEELAKFLTPDSHQRALAIMNGETVYTGDGMLVDSGEFNGQINTEATEAIVEKVSGKNVAKYKLRDWLISRQRYWGAPIPIIYCDVCGVVPVPEKDLPVLLPRDVDFMPTGESPLVRSESFQHVDCPQCGKPARRESDTMDTFVCSSWYYFRFADPRNTETFASKEEIEKWLPVDLYMGGAEHTVLHLLYARFFTKVLQELGYITFNEPFLKLRHQGIILAEDGHKMSKSLGNVINPDDVVALYGADSLRLYEMFMGPIDVSKPWSTENIIGSRRFLERVWVLAQKVADVPRNSVVEVAINTTVKKVGEDIPQLKFNTAISTLMILINTLSAQEQIPQTVYEDFLKLIAPFAPHITEELWNALGHTTSIHAETWPSYDESKTKSDTITIAIQIDGKTRGDTQVASSADKSAVEAAARTAVGDKLEGKTIARVIVVPGRLVNFVLQA